ncbi:MAG: secondary thiamine-phosphate synthase enzyme YjbQ [Candidatus Woesearchaeota archaeon]
MILTIQTSAKNELLDITEKVKKSLDKSRTTVTVYVPHTTAAITINENADPTVKQDILAKLDGLVPQDDNYRHAEGNSDGHIKASLMGASVTIPVIDGKLALGTWQGIFFCEFDGPRERRVVIS